MTKIAVDIWKENPKYKPNPIAMGHKKSKSTLCLTYDIETGAVH